LDVGGFSCPVDAFKTDEKSAHAVPVLASGLTGRAGIY
jgi:hypothetical protein